MRVFLTGSSGYLGAAVLARLDADGHQVIALARSAESARRLPAGVVAAVGDLGDADWLGDQISQVDGVIHTASPNDATSADLDTAFLDTALRALAGSGRPLVYTGGTWIHGSGVAINEDTPPRPPAIVAWRPAFVRRVRAAVAEGIRTVVIGPANLYGKNGGIPAMLAAGPATTGPDPALLSVGGDQHFPNVHRDDIAALYALALTDAPAGSYYLGAHADSPTMAEIATTLSHKRGLEGRIAPEPIERSRERLGPLADPILLDAQIDCSAAHELGWHPAAASLLDELAQRGDEPDHA